MIYADAELSDGMYNINNGKLFKYKAKGGSARVHEIKRLVRCEDCKHYRTSSEADVVVSYCGLHISKTNADDFCSYGERSEE